MTDDYKIPSFVVAEWAKHCHCCPQCNQAPCDGVAAGGMCDEMECTCDDDYDDEQPYGFDSECYMDADGHCAAAGSEYCDFECPNRD